MLKKILVLSLLLIGGLTVASCADPAPPESGRTHNDSPSLAMRPWGYCCYVPAMKESWFLTSSMDTNILACQNLGGYEAANCTN